VHSPKGGALKGVSLRVFPNLPLNNSLFVSSLFSHLVEKKYFHENMGTYKIEGAPLA
jgi:hypothetical protein